MAAITAVPVVAQSHPRFDIPAGALQQSIVAFGTQSGSTVGITGGIGGVRGRPVHGRMPPERALRRMLQGTGLQIDMIDQKTFRILRATAPPHAPKPLAPSAAYAPPLGVEIVVTASKRQTRMGDYPGAVSIIDGQSGALVRSASRGTDALVDSVASLSSTNLGPGRNKLIIRGVADSSFTGPSQAIVGQYLGDVRLNYNAPDPNLSLYDLDRIEVLEGPQGTLYGAGSLGGIVKLVPTPPDLVHWAGSLSAAYLTTRGGAPGNDVSAMINAPLKDGRLALRLVGYSAISGGYIDDARRGLGDVNRSKTQGGRASLRARIGDSWTVELGGLIQNINSRDSQYAERGSRPYQRSSSIAQPFDNDYRLGEITISRTWAGLDLVSATGIINHDVQERFDATSYPLLTPSLFDQKNRIVLITNETRLSHRRDDGSGWLLGTSFISNSERLTRVLGPIGAPQEIAGLRNTLSGGALYGEATVTITPRIQITGGGRVVYSYLTGEVLGLPAGSGDERNRTEKSILPLLAISWRPVHKLTVYARYQEGYRGGGLSVAATGSGVTSQRFRGDSIATFEAGARFGDPMVDSISGAIGFTFAHWENIQADLVDSTGLPYTANIGNGRTYGLEAKAGWRPVQGLSIEAGLFLNDSDLIRPDQSFAAFRHAELPDVARLGGRTAFSYRTPLSGAFNLSVDGAIRYFGHSKLGVGTGLNLRQGGYTDTSFGLRIGSDRIGVSVDATNLLDTHDNRFSLGNPFGVMLGRQITPQRPRTVRFGIDGRF